jgi:outer membrane protein assembly factor BamB
MTSAPFRQRRLNEGKDQTMSRRFFSLLVLFAAAAPARAADWYNWRGPWQNGVSPETNLPDKWSTDAAAPDNNLIWKAPYGCRSTPLVMNGRVYLINHLGDKETVQERVMCLDAETGKLLWEYKFNVWHADIVTVRLGWTNLAGDPQTGHIYAQGTQGLFFCFDKDGKVLWQRSLTEEYGRISGYGGRVTSPIVADDLVIVGMLNSSWGDQGKGGCRFLAMNKLSGEVVWWSEPGGAPLDTFYSVPVVATINGQKLLISGGADGGVYAMKLNTGEKVWTYTFGTGAINCSPVVDGSLVYIGHGEESPDSESLGRVICLDASQVAGGEPKLVWKKDGLKARYASPALDPRTGRLYIPDEAGRLYCLDAKSGKQFWRFSFGRGSRGSPVLADGKIYIGEVNSRFHILRPGDKECESLHTQLFVPREGNADVELNGSPAVANGRVYLTTSDEIFCIGRKDAKPAPEPEIAGPAPSPGKGPAHLQVIPADVVLHSGESATFKARAFDENGDFLKEVTAEWSLPVPPVPPGAKQGPPALKGEIASGKLTVDLKMAAQQGYVLAKADGLTGRARVRVAPRLPYVQDFSKIPDGAVPGGWVNTQGKFLVATRPGGEKVLKKVNDKGSPLIAKGNAFIGMPNLTDYTIESDVMGTQVGDDLPDMGVVANRYTLVLAGNIQKLRIISWDALPRIDRTVNYPWKPKTWYRLKLTVDVQGDVALVKGKCWERGQAEPAAWTLQVTDPRPNTEGSPALFGYVTGIPEGGAGTDIFYAHVRITPNRK